MKADSRNSEPRKVVHCLAKAGNHISKETKTHTLVNSTRAIARQQPT
jgi:hypothetical protein